MLLPEDLSFERNLAAIQRLSIRIENIQDRLKRQADSLLMQKERIDVWLAVIPATPPEESENKILDAGPIYL